MRSNRLAQVQSQLMNFNPGCFDCSELYLDSPFQLLLVSVEVHVIKEEILYNILDCTNAI